jgi:phosphoheptose isomerase
MLFPAKKFDDASAYLNAYAQEIRAAFATVDPRQVCRAAEALEGAAQLRATIFVCGNGGSAAIAGHFACDHMKGVSTGTDLSPRVVSLSSNIELLTAIANDISYASVFAFQLDKMASPGDILITVSSSGSSPNILAAADWAKAHDVTVIAMTGFGGGESRKRADISLHVETENYGVVEDVHQSLMHILAQYLRQKRLLDPAAIGKIKF